MTTSYHMEQQLTSDLPPPWMQLAADAPAKAFGHEVKTSKFADVLRFIIEGQQLSVNNPYNREHSQVCMIALSSLCPSGEKIHPAAEHREASADGLSSDDERYVGDAAATTVAALADGQPSLGEGGNHRSQAQPAAASLLPKAHVSRAAHSARGDVFHYRPIPYARLPCDFPLPIVFGHTCASVLKRNAVRLKIGGVCGDLPPVVMANIIYVVCDVVVAGCDMFTANKGRCCVWARTHADAVRIHECFHHRMWCGPAEIGYAVMCKSVEGAQHFEKRLRTATRSCGSLPFPTHLMTVEFWQDEPPRKAVVIDVPEGSAARRKTGHRGTKDTAHTK